MKEHLLAKRPVRSPALQRGFWRRARHIASPQADCARGFHRVQTQAVGERLWFESPDLPLATCLESFGSALLLPAAAKGRCLAFAAPPDPVWLDNVQQALAVAARWWGYSRPRRATAEPPDGSPAVQVRARHTSALCFSGGVDSFYSLLRGDHHIDAIVFVHGYDIELTDTERARAAEASIRRVAAELGIKAIVVRTNLRTHGAFRTADWRHTHGGALAAVGHLLTNDIDQLLISASYPRVFDRPWGSHWALDPWWSSSRLTVTHVGAEKWRAEKLVAIMHEPAVRKHLRVCWENRSPDGNCGRCEKCLRTMLVLDGHGCLADFPVFPPSATLAANVGWINQLTPDLVPVYTGFLNMALSSDVRAAVAALVERSTQNPAGTVWANPWWKRRARA
jgi:hypothetical protein